MPKVTVFTPSHDTKWLDECYESLNNQTFNDWEWVVLLNNGASWSPPNDNRVKSYSTDSLGIGKLKNEAVSFASGDYLVELDHDDKLASNALEKIIEAFKNNSNVSFVYSHFAQINEDGSRNDNTFNPTFGWTYQDIDVAGVTYLQCNSMHHYPSAMSYIWYAPNHVRAFRKSTYDAIGGYNPNMEILDDLDIMCRMYQESDFYLIDECLYLQRVHPGNSQVRPELNERIQVETVEIYENQVQANALAWAKRNNLRCLDLGGAYNSPPEYESVDLLPNADLVGDVFDVLASLDNNSVGVIRAVDFLEHIPDKITLFNEMYRVLAHGGMLLSLTPSSDGRAAFQDPTHVSFYNENSFWYYTNKQFAQYVPEIKCRFQNSLIKTLYFNEWYVQNRMPYVCANLVAIKDGPRIAGPLDI